MVGIISNTASLNAQANLTRASADSQASISRLSSGNKISRAADDVAGLAIGTILKTNVSTLSAALSNTSQANSLLGVADGALQNIGEILQRQKALAAQATSGSLTAQARGYLNQEFQNLTQEINQIATTTNFNGINLVDGSLFASANIQTDQTRGTRAQATLDITTNAAANDTLVLGGQTFTFVATGTATLANEIEVGASATATATNIAAKLNAITDVTSAVSAAGALVTASASGSVLTLTSKAESSAAATGNITLVTSGTVSAKLNGAATATTLSGSLIGGTNGGLGLQAGKTTVSGTVGDALVNASPTLTGVTGNKDFVGTISGFKGTYNSADQMEAQIQIGNFTYKTVISDTTPTAAATYRFSSEQAGGGYFDVQIAAAGAAVTNQTDADSFARRLDQAFSTLAVSQQHTVSSYKPGGTVFNGTTSLGTLAGSSFSFKTSDFTNAKIDSVKVYEPTAGANTTTIEAVINGEVYRNAAVSTTAGNFTLTNVNNSNKTLDFTIGTGNINLASPGNAGSFQKSLENAFGIKNGGSGLTFQVGTNAADNIGVQIQSAKTEDIFKDNSGTAKVLDISTVGDNNSGAVQAGQILNNAISTVTSLRANIGALESRFSYASANIQSAIQNQDAARSTFLDTDVAAESSNYAQAQVRLQASISVLAQANQLPQNLLKLLG